MGAAAPPGASPLHAAILCTQSSSGMSPVGARALTPALPQAGEGARCAPWPEGVINKRAAFT
jgi:hypothetical protein